MSSTNAPICTVTNAGKLPKEVGADALCQAITKALSEASVPGRVTVEVSVRSPSSLAAKIKRDDKTLPEMTFDVSDSVMTKGSVGHFARSVAQFVKGS